MTTWRRIAKRIRVPLGFVFAVVFLLFARPSAPSVLWSLLLVAPGLWLRGYAAGYVKKNAELTVTGPYAWTRNPLYLGSMLVALGFAAAARSYVLTALLAGLFAAIYIPVIRGEEEFLRSQFPGFAAYAATVPSFLPWRGRVHTPGAEQGRFAPELYRKHREYNASIGAAALYLALILRIAFGHER